MLPRDRETFRRRSQDDPDYGEASGLKPSSRRVDAAVPQTQSGRLRSVTMDSRFGAALKSRISNLTISGFGCNLHADSGRAFGRKVDMTRQQGGLNERNSFPFFSGNRRRK